MFRLFLLYDLSSLSVSLFLFSFTSRIGWSTNGLDHCVQLRQQAMSHGIYTPVWCIAASVLVTYGVPLYVK